MTLINVLVASSAVALGVLFNSAVPANALVAQGGHGLAARGVAHSPNHNGVLKRKRGTHKNRKRCVAQVPVTPSSSADNSQYTPPATGGDSGSNNNNNNSGNNNNNSGSNGNSGAPSTSPAPACSGGKVGLAWGPSMPSNYIPNAITGKTCWYYNWSAWAADSSFTGGLKFVPMLWGYKSVGDFRSQVFDNPGANYGLVLAMNEVNQHDQSQMDPAGGVSLWNELIAPLKQRGYYLISPSTTSAPDGIPWMQQWINGGLSVQPDALSLHWYGTNYNDFHNYIESFIAAFPGRRLWITEFACTDFNGGNCDAMAFANQAIPYLDNNPAIEAYFPFAFDGTMSNVGEPSRLMTGDGWVTDLGHRYIN
ncbi:glycoside hydrolase family 128 protein [Serendipita vermifera MAFF 305830]|uniref:Glycoside hydrolase family 128 protein n=1 Tax=Serendipita vermifera MAFF 305830 TaxID=933852 RepID=A0A0C3BPP9_SERVB|nr:glycoside hydrolase family 128 protein [Serendipita vermifera MAFF 305830]